jgi:two-component system osmolarity sensor histidine kinase EnvZ
MASMQFDKKDIYRHAARVGKYLRHARHSLSASRPMQPFRALRQSLYRMTPKGLYTRSLLIIILPMIVLQSIVAFVFMERHWQMVTRRLSSMVTADVAAMLDVYKTYPQDVEGQTLSRIARDNLHLTVELLPPGDLPAPLPKPFFSLLDDALSRELRMQIGKPFWIDTVGRSNIVEIRIQLDNAIMRVYAPRNQAYASNSHIFIVWMVASAAVLILVSILFLRNQIKPILTLADAADAFGKGREFAPFRPRGAREVRAAAHAFIVMQKRIERQIEQRTTMLNGVSHDLRTLLTRFKLQLALLKSMPETEALVHDVDDMQHMLEDYLAFARGDAGEKPATIDFNDFLNDVKKDHAVAGKTIKTEFSGEPQVMLLPKAFRRCIDNLVANAVRHTNNIRIRAAHEGGTLNIDVEDDGPGIPEAQREDVFRPFFRLDDARNQDKSGTGLGLAIARDIATSHGGDIILGESKLGGLKASVRIPG